MPNGTSKVVLTSIPPSNDGRLASIVPAVLRSFEANGLATVSVNWPQEIDRVRSLYPGVTAVGASPAHFPVFPSRYGPTLGSVFDAAAAYPTIGICNADVPMLTSDIGERIERQPQTFFAAHRLDVDRMGGDIVGFYRRGIDAVFFDRHHFRDLLNDENLVRFQLGAPFWDILMPILASFHGPVSFIEPPFIIHPIHKARWSEPDYEVLREIAISTVVRHAERHSARRPQARAFLTLFERYVGRATEPLSRRATKNAMMIFNLWLAKLERERTTRLNVRVDGELSAFALTQLERSLPDTPTEIIATSGAAKRTPVIRRWTSARLREWKRRRRERAVDAHLADIEF
jgi:hypothetical protein